jgi:hypothetical protein
MPNAKEKRACARSWPDASDFRKVANGNCNDSSWGKVIFTRPDGTIEEYILKGGDPLVWEDVEGSQHSHVLEEPYTSIQIVNP